MTKEKQKTERKYVRFGLDGYVTQFPYWSKTHKQLSVVVKRKYENGEIVETDDEELLKLAEKYKHTIQESTGQLYNRETDKIEHAKIYRLPLNNLEYLKGNIDYYSNGASNTKQEIKLWLTFLIGDNKCILEHNYKTSGSHATPMYYKLSNIDMILEDICSSGKIEDVGIGIGDEEDFEIVVVNKQLQLDSFEISENELLESLILIEVVDFDIEIN